jgi:uncharacterized protein (TIGR02646 family)
MNTTTQRQILFRKTTPQKRVVDYNPGAEYKSYRKLLKEDFKGRCGYCDSYYGIVKKDYHIDHFVPRKVFEKLDSHKHLENDYSNLIYSCPSCNISKSGKWISEHPDISIVNEEGFVNPCSEEYDALFYRDGNGAIQPIENNKTATYIHKELKLFLIRHQTAWKIESIMELVEEAEVNPNPSDKDLLIKELVNNLRKHFEMEITDDDE